MDKWTLWEHDKSKFIITIDQESGLDILFDINAVRYRVSMPGDNAKEDPLLTEQDVKCMKDEFDTKLRELNRILHEDPDGVLRYDSTNELRKHFEDQAKDTKLCIDYCTKALKFISDEQAAFENRKLEAKTLSDDTTKQINTILENQDIKIITTYRTTDGSGDVPLYVVELECSRNELIDKYATITTVIESQLSDVDMNLEEDGNLILFYKEGL